MNVLDEFVGATLEEKIRLLFEHGTFVTSIRYYRYKVNLYLLGQQYFEVFVSHKHVVIERIEPLDEQHTRMKFYLDQIRLSV